MPAPTPDPVQTPPSPGTNWAQAQEYIRTVNFILEKNPTCSYDLPLNPDRPNAQPDTTPSDSDIHISSPIIKAMQAEIEWLIAHVAGQDQHIIDLQTELDFLKQGAIRSYSEPAPPPPPRRPMSQANHTPVVAAPPPPTSTDIPPPADFADAPIPNVPVSNRFECLTAEDADIYDIPGSPPAQPDHPPAVSSRPIPRPRPRRPRATTSQKKRRPKVSNVASSMIRDQEIHQKARGLDAKCQAFSGRCAHEIQPHVQNATAEDDDAIVLGGGTNNIPRDNVADIIIDIARLIDHTREIRPSQHIIIPQMLNRYDTNDYEYHNEKIRRVNIFLKHRCTKDSRMHYLPLDIIDRDDLYDGLHMDYTGKDKFAAAVADLVLSWDLE